LRDAKREAKCTCGWMTKDLLANTAFPILVTFLLLAATHGLAFCGIVLVQYFQLLAMNMIQPTDFANDKRCLDDDGTIQVFAWMKIKENNINPV
jgi:hypothetical protein